MNYSGFLTSVMAYAPPDQAIPEPPVRKPSDNRPLGAWGKMAATRAAVSHCPAIRSR